MQQAIQTPAKPQSTTPFSFDWLIAPFSKETFFSEYYEQGVFKIIRKNPNYYKKLLSLQQLDELFYHQQLSFPDTRVVSKTQDIPQEEYTRNGQINLVEMLKKYEEGATVILSALHKRLASLGSFCDSMAKTFSHKFQTNIYLTPGNSQGFKVHYDTHDVIVLQVEGSKKWRIYENPIELPLKLQAFEKGKYEPGKLQEEFVLKAGDLLYIPRGVMHEAETNNELSLHITVGLIGFTWADFLLDMVLDAAKNNVAFRKNLPVGFFDKDPELYEPIVKSLTKTLSANISPHQSIDRFRSELINWQSPNLAGQFRQVSGLKRIKLASLVAKRNNILFTVKKTENQYQINAMGKQIDLPLFTGEAIQYLLQTDQPFRVNDLPDCMDSKSKKVFVRRLVKEGLLKVVQY